MSTLPLSPDAPTPLSGGQGGGAHAVRAFWVALVLPVMIVAALHVATTQFGASGTQEVLRLTQATRIASPSLAPPGEGSGAPATLPFLERRDVAALPQPAWFVVHFDVAVPARTPWMLGVSFRPTLVAYLDGHLLEQSAPTELLDRGDLHFQLGSRTLQVRVPPTLLQAGHHELQLRVGSPGYDGAALSSLRLGPAEAVSALQDARDFMQGVRAIIAVASAALGIFLVLAWVALREEWLYGLAGVNCLLVALLLSPNLLAAPPLPATWWRALLDAADVAAKGLVLAIVMHLFEAGPARVARWVAAYVVVGIVIDVQAALDHVPWTDFSHPWPWWALGSRGAVLGTATALACIAAWRHGGWRWVAAAVVVGLGAWIWLYVSLLALVVDTGTGVTDLNFVGYGAWVLMIGVLLQRRHVASLRREEHAREELERQVAERTAALEANFAALRESERLRMAAAERERLLQEMHDGLGSQLVAAKMSAQRGTLTPEEVVQTFEDCLQEMRLAVDGLSVSDGDLALLLANLRHRLGARLRAAGLELEWSVGDTPLVPALAGAGGADLVRIVQEALNNVMHHAHASRIRIATRRDGEDAVLLTIADNGRGMPAERSEGRGLLNIRSRAARIGAGVEWRDLGRNPGAPEGNGGGTELRVRLPLGPPGVPGRR